MFAIAGKKDDDVYEQLRDLDPTECEVYIARGVTLDRSSDDITRVVGSIDVMVNFLAKHSGALGVLLTGEDRPSIAGLKEGWGRFLLPGFVANGEM